MFGNVGQSGNHESDDEEFFKPAPNTTGKSTLAKIFGIGPKVTVNSNNERANAPVAPKPVKISDRYGPSNFRYIPAEQADDDEAIEDASKPPEWTIVRALVVTAYKLVDGDNVFLGKLGLALLNSSSGHRLLLYRTKTDVLGTVTLTRDTKILLKQDYLQFRADDSNDFWSILFESEFDRKALLTAIESWCCVEREPVVEEPLSEVEKEPEPPKSKRSELAARMARMGGQAMPSMHEKTKAPPIPTTAPGSDSSDTSDSKIETITTRTTARRPNLMSTVSMQMVPLAGMMPTNGNAVPNQATGATMADMNFNLVMSESRMQNTEMRMNLTKLESKLDRVLDKIDLLSVHGAGDRSSSSVAADKDAEVLELEEKLLELKRANHALKSKVRTLETADRDGKREAEALMEGKLRTLEESERRLKESVLSLELRLEASRSEIGQQKEKLAGLETQLVEEKHSVESKTKEMKATLQQLEEAQRERNRLNEQIELGDRRLEELQAQLAQLQKECNELKEANQRQRPSVAGNATLVKDIMNGCFQQLCGQITDPQVLKIIAQTIKRETKAALEREGEQ
uniref:WH1 domain-containing protein n=1 Tax=Anopheles stephensi TaxID=30069 RepID=A0A182XW30_ANOST